MAGVPPAPASAAPDPRPFARMPGGLAPLGYRNFLLFWAGFAATNAGKWIENTGAVWVAYALTGDPFLLGLMGVARAVPTLLVTPFAGVVADRLDLRRLVLATQSIMMITSLLTGLLILWGKLELWQLYLEVMIQSAVLSVDYIARQALFPRLVPRGHLAEAVTLQSSAARTAGLVGPAIGGLSIAAWGNAAPFLLNAVTYLLLIGALGVIRDVAMGAIGAVRATWRTEMVDGWRYLLQDPVLRGLLLLELVYAIFQMNPVLITIVAREVLDVGPEGLGGLLSAASVGALTGTGILIAIRGGSRPGRYVTIAAIVCSVAMLGLAAAQTYAVAFAALAIVGVFDAMVAVIRQSIAQLAAPPAMRGRVIANTGTVVRGLGPLAQAQSGVAGGILGGPVAVVVAAAALAASAALVALVNRPLWDFVSPRGQAGGGHGHGHGSGHAEPGPAGGSPSTGSDAVASTGAAPAGAGAVRPADA